MMMRRRPIARAAVRTTAVVGTAAVVGGHMANKQAEAQEPQAPAAEPQSCARSGAGSSGPRRSADAVGGSEGLGSLDRGRIPGGKGETAFVAGPLVRHGRG